MGKTQKPLSILVLDRATYDSSETQALVTKGHTIIYQNGDDSAYDVVIGPQCWRIIPSMGSLETQLTMMLAGVRNTKYPKKAK